MKPLQSIAMGLVILFIGPTEITWDPLPNPIGWLLVLIGTRALPAGFPRRRTLIGLGVVALLASIALFFPDVLQALDDADDSLAWAANLPQFSWYLLLCLALADAAGEAREPGPERWWRSLAVGCAAIIALPVLVFGGGIDALEVVAGGAVALVPALMIVVLFVHSGRSWAGAPEVTAA